MFAHAWDNFSGGMCFEVIGAITKQTFIVILEGILSATSPEVQNAFYPHSEITVRILTFGMIRVELQFVFSVQYFTKRIARIFFGMFFWNLGLVLRFRAKCSSMKWQHGFSRRRPNAVVVACKRQRSLMMMFLLFGIWRCLSFAAISRRRSVRCLSVSSSYCAQSFSRTRRRAWKQLCFDIFCRMIC